MVWTISIGGNRNNRIKDWSKFTIESNLNLFGQFKIELLSVNEYERSKKFVSSHLLKSLVEFRRKDVLVFSGFIEDVNPISRGVEIVGRSIEVLLKDDKINARNFPQNPTITNASAKTYIERANTDGYFTRTKVVAGDIEDSGLATINQQYSHDNLASFVNDLTYRDGQDWYVERRGDNFHLIVKNERGKGSSTTPSRTFNANKRQVTISYDTQSLLDVATKVTVLGKGDGVNQITETIPTATNTHTDSDGTSYTTYMFDNHATNDRGQIWVKIRRPEIDNSAEAVRIGKKYLDDRAELFRKFQIDSVKYTEGLGVGDYIQVVDKKRELDEIVRVKSIKRIMERGRREKMVIDVVNPADRLENRITEFEREELIRSSHQQGATNHYQIDLKGNTSRGYFESPTYTTDDTDASFRYDSTSWRIAQTFVAAYPKIRSVKVKLQEIGGVGMPDLYVAIWSTTAGVPDCGNVINSGDEGNVVVTPTGSMTTIEATFATEISVTVGNTYAIVIGAVATSVSTSNYWKTRTDTSAPSYTDGQVYFQDNSDDSWTGSAEDMYFEVTAWNETVQRLRHVFYLPNEFKTLNSLKLSFTLSNYKYYDSTTSEELEDTNATLSNLKIGILLGTFDSGTRLTDTNCTDLDGADGFVTADDWFTAQTTYKNIELKNQTILTWTANTLYQLEFRIYSDNPDHKCRLNSQLRIQDYLESK